MVLLRQNNLLGHCGRNLTYHPQEFPMSLQRTKRNENL